MTVEQLIDLLSTLRPDQEVRMLGERSTLAIKDAARPIIALLEPTPDAPFDFAVLIEPGT